MNKAQITVAFLDVGQGDSIIIILPAPSSAIVVDCPSKDTTIDYLNQKGITVLNYVFLTHTDRDHIGGIINLIDCFLEEAGGKIDAIAYNLDTHRIATGVRKAIFQRLGELIDNYDLKTLSPQLDQSWTLQDVVVDVLHPADRDIKRVALTKDTNNASVMLRITFAGRRVLLTADIGAQGWQWVAERKTDLQADVLKFPHHGAWYEAKDQQSSLAEILRQVNPSVVVLSVGTHNSYPHPHPNTFSLLRSQSHLRFVCTEATWQCHIPLKSASSNIPCPCAGTVEVVIGNNQIKVMPDRATHAEVIKGFDTPQCKA